MQTAVEQTVKELGGLDVLVNKAAFQLHTRYIEDLSDVHSTRREGRGTRTTGCEKQHRLGHAAERGRRNCQTTP